MHLITFSGLRFALYGLNATSLSLSTISLRLLSHPPTPPNPYRPRNPTRLAPPTVNSSIALVASALRCFLPLGYRLSFVPLSNSSYRKLVPDLSLSSLHRL